MTDTVSPTSTGTSYDVARVRAHFPQLREGEGLGAAHFDGPGGSQTPDVVAQAVYDTLTAPLANEDTVTSAERNATPRPGRGAGRHGRPVRVADPRGSCSAAR